MIANKTVRSVLALAAMCAMSACAAKGGGSHPAAPAAPAPQQDVNNAAAAPVVQTKSFNVVTTYDNGSRAAAQSAGMDSVLMSVRTASLTDVNNLQTVTLLDEVGATQLTITFAGANYMNGSIVSVATITPAITGTAAVDMDASGMLTAIHGTLNNGVTVTWALSAVGSTPDVNQGQNQNQTLPKQDAPKQDMPKQDAPKQDMPKQDAPKQDLPKQDAPKQDLPKQDAPKQDIPKQDAPKQDIPKQDAPKQDIPKQDAPKQDIPKQDAPKQDLPKQDAPKQDLPKQDAPKQDLPKQDMPKQDIPKGEHK